MAANGKKLRSSLYVGDLHPDVTEKDLTDTFSRVAPLLSVHLCRHKPSGRSLCYAYVNFWLPCHAFTALKCLNHTLMKGKPIRVMWNERDPTARKDNNANLFVKNLDKSVTSPILEEAFSKYGTVVSCKVAHENGISKGFGFVQFDSEDSAVAARTALHDAILAGKKLYVTKFLRKNERNGAEGCFKSLYVKNLDEDITADVLKDRFSAYGKVSDAVIMRDEKGSSKGFGFVNFDSHEAAKKAMEFLNGEKLGFKNIVVDRAMKKSELRNNAGQMSGNTYTDHNKESLTGAQLKEQEYRMLHKPCEKFPRRPFYAAECQQRQLCNFTYFSGPAPFKQPSTTLHSTLYQYFASSPFKASYPIIPQNLHGTFDASHKKVAALNGEMPKAQKLLSPLKLGSKGDGKVVSAIKTLKFPKEIATLVGYIQEGYLDMPEAQKLLSPMKLGSNGFGKELSTSRTIITIRPGCTLQEKTGSASLKLSTKMITNAH
ncbi:polyadenylate-binding protein 6-like isoform X2 [Salvia miltiorrhiza]|uniref:polyadenylate-binding protein 6-like isoform X2 n=1 Tax=Salvia miltiorrhiza TaxID=226208 RepID=UPI0025AC103C|nr:polyadenylate-binding protein 6-like isoform X2 [Salvia miltiorrhiza]